jgi:hypothetical protein
MRQWNFVTSYIIRTQVDEKLTWARAQIIKRHDTERYAKVNEWLHTFLTWAQQGHLSGSAQGGFTLSVRDGRKHRPGERVWTHSRAGRFGEE